MPLVLRGMQDGASDAISPYGYAGILSDRPKDQSFHRAAMDAAIELLRAEGVVSLLLRLHPLLPVDGIGHLGQTVAIPTVVVDLSGTPEQIWSGMRKNHRRDIERARRLGHEFQFEDSPEAFAAFRRIYAETMVRQGASDYYLFDDAYFDGLQSALGDRLMLATVRVDGDVAAAGLFTRSNGIVQLHLSGSDDAHAIHWTTKLLYHGVATSAQEYGDRWFHLGGGRGGANDSLFHFKAGFSSHRAVYDTMRLVIREADYEALVRAHSPGVDPHEPGGYFPHYRRPIRSAASDIGH